MTKNHVVCALVTAFNTKQSFVWHERLGAFHSDWHQHPKGQLMYAENGCMHLDIEGKKLLLPSWYCAWVPAATNHAVWSASPDLYVRTVYLGQEVTIGSVFEKSSVFPVTPLLKEMICYTEKWHKVLTDDVDEVAFLQALQHILPGHMIKPANVSLPSTSHPKLFAVLEFMQNHSDNKYNLMEVSERFGLSPRTLARLFQAQLGISFSSYAKVARVIKALELIERGKDNVSELAYQVGYESISTFSNNFLEICGNRPLYFIQKKRK